jgi:predicted unusual protein kinase regulating ubiquinone biosynthesis (AarF/ABC1/UbiB family)
MSKDLREDLVARLLAASKELPTSSVGRLGRMALSGLRSGRLVRRLRRREPDGDGDVDVEALARIVSSIGELKGISMKVGQIMSYIDVDVPDELREALGVLQTHAQPMDTEQVRAILVSELGDGGRRLAGALEPTPIAAASIGQVHRARLADSTLVAVKVQYPDIERAIENDFRPASMGSAMASMFYQGARIDGFIREARERFLEECDYLHEARCQERFRELFEDHPWITVPAVHADLCSRRVLTTTFIEGASFERFLASDPDQDERDRLGEAMFEFYVGSLFRHGLYNCDPHPGNYLFLRDGRVAMLDHGCTREFGAGFIQKLVRLTEAVQSDERDLLHRAFLDLGMVREDVEYDFDTARELVRRFYGPMLRDEVTAIELGAGAGMRRIVLRKRQMMKLTMPGEFLFLFRIRLGLMAVLARMGSRANWYRLERSYIAGG